MDRDTDQVRQDRCPNGRAPQCPHCAATLAGLSLPGEGLAFALFRFRCPACTRTWSEFREADTVQRIWTPARAR